MAALTSGDLQAAITTVQYSRQTHVEWAAYLRRNPTHEPGAVGDAEYHDQAVREYDNVLAVLQSSPGGSSWLSPEAGP